MCALLRQNVRSKALEHAEGYQHHARGMRGFVLRMRVWRRGEALRITSPRYDEVWGNCYDYVLVVGERNSSWESEAHVAESMSEIMAFRHPEILIN